MNRDELIELLTFSTSSISLDDKILEVYDDQQAEIQKLNKLIYSDVMPEVGSIVNDPNGKPSNCPQWIWNKLEYIYRQLTKDE